MLVFNVQYLVPGDKKSSFHFIRLNNLPTDVQKKQHDQKFMVLMQAAQQGDQRAYRQLLNDIMPLIQGFVHNRIGHGNDTDDITQNVLTGIHKSSHTYNTERSFTNWMFAIAANKLNDYLRSYYRTQSHETINIDDAHELFDERVTIDDDTNELLQEMLQLLSPKQRQIVHALKIEGYTAKEVAKQMGLTEINVKVIAHRALKLLHDHAVSKVY